MQQSGSIASLSAVRISQPPGPIAVRSESIATNLIVTWFIGHVTNESAARALPEFRYLLSRTTNPKWIMELTSMSGFEPRAVSTGGIWWNDFKARGGTEILFISMQPAARMAGATLSFSTGLGVRTFATLDECYEAIGTVLPLRRPEAG
jgi:hypothetical protein